jgi:hypothetical protein
VSENLKLWNVLEKTDPAHTKKFTRAGGFKGTAVKPIYCDRKMTEQFGACGIGWGMTEPRFEVVPVGEEIAVYCTVGLWHGDHVNLVYGVGGDFVAKKNKNGLFADDEAFKKAYTDALGNAMKHLGMSADIHMGQHDDDKYVTALRREIDAGDAEPKTKPEQKPGLVLKIAGQPDRTFEFPKEWFAALETAVVENQGNWTINRPTVLKLAAEAEEWKAAGKRIGSMAVAGTP